MRRPSSRSDCLRSMEVLRKLTIFRASHGSFLQPRRLNIANPETPQKGSGFPPTPRRKARSKSLPKLLETPFSTLKRQSHTEQPQTLPVPSCVPFSMSGACGGKARPPRQAAMYVRGSFFGVLSGFKYSGEDFDSELRCSAAHAGTTKCSGQDSPTREAWFFTIVVRKVHMILARQTSQKSGAEHPNLFQDWEQLYRAFRHTEPESPNPNTTILKPYTVHDGNGTLSAGAGAIAAAAPRAQCAAAALPSRLLERSGLQRRQFCILKDQCSRCCNCLVDVLVSVVLSS